MTGPSMPVHMVDIRGMGVGVPHGLMPVDMAVRPDRHGVMDMIVMPVVVDMRVLVLQRFMLMLVRV